MSLGSKIKDLRKKAGLTQVQLADKLDKSVRTIQKYESGEIEPNLEVLNSLVKIFDIFPNELLQEMSDYDYIVTSTSCSTSIRERMQFDNSFMQQIIVCLGENNELPRSILLGNDLDIITEMVKEYIISLVSNISNKNYDLIIKHPEILSNDDELIESMHG